MGKQAQHMYGTWYQQQSNIAMLVNLIYIVFMCTPSVSSLLNGYLVFEFLDLIIKRREEEHHKLNDKITPLVLSLMHQEFYLHV